MPHPSLSPLPADGSFEKSHPFSTHVRTHTTHTHTATISEAILTGVLPEEALGAPKVLPDQRRVSLKIIYEDFIQSLGPVHSVHDVGV